jgi:hypothetical protein
MSRRPLVACLVTTAVGALTGALLGAIVGRVIALFGDETVQTSVPMIFCGTLGYFVGGASAAKGSLERFGAARAAVGSAIAGLVLVLLVGGASLSRTSGPLIGVIALVAIAVASVAACIVGRPQEVPVTRAAPLAREPRPTQQPEPPKKAKAVKAPKAPKEPKPPKVRKQKPSKSGIPGLFREDRDADLSDLFDDDTDELVEESPTRVEPAPEPYRPRASTAARRVPTVEPEPEPEIDEDEEDWGPELDSEPTFAKELEDWEPEDEQADELEDDEPEDDVEEDDAEEYEEEEPEPDPAPVARPRRERPLRAVDATKAPASEEVPPAAPRPRRDRPLRKGDA